MLKFSILSWAKSLESIFDHHIKGSDFKFYPSVESLKFWFWSSVIKGQTLNFIHQSKSWNSELYPSVKMLKFWILSINKKDLRFFIWSSMKKLRFWIWSLGRVSTLLERQGKTWKSVKMKSGLRKYGKSWNW